MNWDQMKGNWKQLKGKAKQIWGVLTESERHVAEGKCDELIGKLQARCGFSDEKAKLKAKSWCNGS